MEIRMKKEEMIKKIYDTIPWRFYWDTLEVNLHDILSFIYRLQEWEYKKWEENSQFPQIVLSLCDIYEYKKDTIENQSIECIKEVYNLLTK